MNRVLITDRFAVEALGYLKGDARFEVMQSASYLPTAAELADAEALIIRSRTPINAALLSQAPKLKIIVTATSGFDHIDFSASQAHGAKVMHTPEANAISATELTWALVLACARRVPEAHKAVKAGDWRREALIGLELSGKTYGIVGLGRIGSRVAKIANAFGMQVMAFDPYKDEEHFNACGATRVSFEEVLKVADVLSFHVPRTRETKHMVNRGNLEYINRGAILVNTSRGEVVHEAELCEALESGFLRAVGLDVFEKEPLNRNSPLLGFNNVVFSPHIGATTTEAFLRASMEAAEKVKRYFTSGVLEDVLPPPEPWFTTDQVHFF